MCRLLSLDQRKKERNEMLKVEKKQQHSIKFYQSREERRFSKEKKPIEVKSLKGSQVEKRGRERGMIILFQLIGHKSKREKAFGSVKSDLNGVIHNGLES